MSKMHIRRIEPRTKYQYRFSICTLVTQKGEYDEMVRSFSAAGFDESNSEFIYIDNSQSNQFDAYRGINCFLNEARGEFIILCHQDILLKFDARETLEKRLSELDALDSSWGVCSNAGGVAPNHVVYKISYPETETMVKGKLPSRVFSVDENFIVVKRDANLALSSNLSGYHLYGTDLCLIADILGYSSYAIDFNLLHKSRGKVNESFYAIQEELRRKYTKALRGRFIQTTISRFYISGSILNNFVCNHSMVMFFSRMYNGLKKRV